MEQLLGEIRLFPYGYAPEGWMQCSGQLLPIASNTALFTLLGVNFGGDGVSTFALPNLTGKEPAANLHYYLATQGLYPARP